MKLTTLMKRLSKMGVEVCGTTAEFYGDDSKGVWVSLETGLLSGLEYYGSKLETFLDDAGYFLENHDAGTGMIWQA